MSLNIFQKNRKATRIGVIFLALVIIAGGGYYVYRQFFYKAPVQAAAETLQTTTAKRGDLELYASGTGSYIAASTASIGFDTSGQIRAESEPGKGTRMVISLPVVIRNGN